METDAENRCLVASDDEESSQMESSEQAMELFSDALLANIEFFLLECISSIAHLFETIFEDVDVLKCLGKVCKEKLW